MISKGPVSATRHRLLIGATQNARSAIQCFVESIECDRQVRVLVPAYFGWSPNEGSGVMDPLLRAGAEVLLCRVDRNLRVDMVAYSELLARYSPDVVMLIHYFGWKDPNLDQLVQEANAAGSIVLIDEAHSLLSCLLTERPAGVSASAVSVHKSLPCPGGLLVQVEQKQWGVRSSAMSALQSSLLQSSLLQSPLFQSGYDLPAVAGRRVRNAQVILDQIHNEDLVETLYKEIPSGVVPLNVPILVPPNKRQGTYLAMNELGYGVVSLYYKLGPGIDPIKHSDSFWLSERMINLPCHQDVDFAEIPLMLSALKEVLAD